MNIVFRGGGPADGHVEEDIEPEFIEGHETIKVSGPDASTVYKRGTRDGDTVTYTFVKQQVTIQGVDLPES